MLQLTNDTPFSTERSVQTDKDGNQIWTVLIKASYILKPRERPEIAPEQEPVCLAPVYVGGPARSSLLRESEMVAEHPGTDVTILGCAHAPGGKPAQFLDVGVSVGPISKTIRVFGDRVWENGVFGPRMSQPTVFTTMPLVYERAYGGTMITDAKTGAFEHEPRNPIGRGFAVKSKDTIGRPLPNLEDPKDLITSWSSRPKPVGFGPIPASWAPRLARAGTFDDRWKNERLPLWPEDYDPRHHQSAHPDLVIDPPLVGGELVELMNLTPDSKLTFKLPRAYLTVDTFLGDNRLSQAVQLDRVIIEPDAKKLVMVWRASLNCRANVRRVKKTLVGIKPRLRLG